MILRIAILSCCDFSVVGGAERFIIDIARALDATIVSPGFFKNIDKTYHLEDVGLHFLNKTLPKEPLKQIVGMKIFSKLKLDYDFYISTDDMSMHYLNKKVPHLYYIFTPRRAFYDMYYDVMSTKHGIKSIMYSMGIWLFRKHDRSYVNKNIKNIACISNNVRNRIRNTYLRDAEVIYPCIDVSKYEYKPHKGYWLSVNRVDKWKRADLQVEAFRQMPDKKLLIVGTVYDSMRDIVDNAPVNVSFVGNVSEQELIKIYSECIGLITTAIDEDFGITPLEAMASGKPVVATKEGGYLESVIDGHTGILVTPTIKEIIKAVKSISQNPESYKFACEQQADKFDYSIFKKHIMEVVNESNALEFF